MPGSDVWVAVVALLSSFISVGGVAVQIVKWRREVTKARVDEARVELEDAISEREHTGEFQQRLLQRVKQLEEREETRLKKLDELEVQNRRLRQSYRELEGVHNKLTRSYQELEGVHNKLTRSYQELMHSYQALLLEYERLSRDYKAVKEYVRKVEEENAKLRARTAAAPSPLGLVSRIKEE